MCVAGHCTRGGRCGQDVARSCDMRKLRYAVHPLWTDEWADAPRCTIGFLHGMRQPQMSISPLAWQSFCRSHHFRLRMFCTVASSALTPDAARVWPPPDVLDELGRARWPAALAFRTGILETAVKQEVRVPDGFHLGRGSPGLGNNCFISTCAQLLPTRNTFAQ